jgi:tetratricopeptide (TPR) repeat protein
MLTMLCLGITLILLAFFRYFKGHIKKDVSVTFAELNIGNVSFKLSDALCLFLLGCGVLGYREFLGARSAWGYILSEDHIKEKVTENLSMLVPEKYRELLRVEKEQSKTPEDEQQLDIASSLYYNGEYEKCIEMLPKINTSNESIRDELLYFSIMAQYRLYDETIKRYEVVPPEKLKELESKFVTFLKERRESKRFSTIQYWLGHFYLQVCRDTDKALPVFDDIVKNYAYSSWIQGSLYYSAILHKKISTPKDKQIAFDNLKTLRKIDNLLKIVEIDRDVDSAGIAEQLLKEWGEPSDSNNVAP